MPLSLQDISGLAVLDSSPFSMLVAWLSYCGIEKTEKALLDLSTPGACAHSADVEAQKQSSFDLVPHRARRRMCNRRDSRDPDLDEAEDLAGLAANTTKRPGRRQ